MTKRTMQEATFLILTALAAGSQHGYGIITDVREISGGRVLLRAGTLYTTPGLGTARRRGGAAAGQCRRRAVAAEPGRGHRMSEPAALERRCRRLPLVLLTGWTILAAVMPRHSRPVLSSGPDKPGVA